jgi:hypothetical protein
MKYKSVVLAGMFASVLAAGAANAANLSVEVYNGFTDTGSGITFSGSPNLTTTLAVGATGFYYDWNSGDIPGYNASNVFAADFSGDLSVAASGIYTLSFGSDDAGYLYVNGTQVASEPGAHGFYAVGPSVFLHAGLNPFEIQYDNIYCCGAVTSLQLPSGVTEVAGVPESSTWALMLLGLGGLGALVRAHRRADRELAALSA